MKTLGSRQVLLGVLAVALVVLAWIVVRGAQGPTSPSTPGGQGAAATAGPTPRPSGTDPDSGLPWVNESALPRQAQDTLALIRAGGPFPYPRSDNQTFTNREGLLPAKARGYYREFTVVTPGSADRGARRIITGSRGETYWTDDHYASFSRIREGT
ncbi:ribonuclease domain-containing protein [Terrabacter aerolatus]|uniref:Ribonuclease N1 n=1 Tax=Terrabacter aerolatus TaxID=422442 RepID=A0A512CXJ7_9MICO|nr:ribonuclease domain-containing protein [Terrabacter aerolatus]GEO28942.1 ribonuclease N1 [Terrabacter aerolatus]